MCCSIVGNLIAMGTMDIVGRRPLMIVGCFLQTAFMFMTAGLATKRDLRPADVHGVVAGLILFSFAVRLSLTTLAFLTNAEIGSVRLRKKQMTFASSVDVLSAFSVTYSVPYLLGRPGAALGPAVAWIFAGMCALSLVFAVLCFPELKGRSLEETDELFERRLWAWQFAKAKTTGAGARIHALENGSVDDLEAAADDAWDRKDAGGGKDGVQVRTVEVAEKRG